MATNRRCTADSSLLGYIQPGLKPRQYVPPPIFYKLGVHPFGKSIDAADQPLPLLACQYRRPIENLPVQDVQRDDLYPPDAVVKGYSGNDAPIGMATATPECKVPQTVEDDPMAVSLNPLEEMGMVPQHHVCACVDCPVRGAHLIRLRLYR
jgi:hypothetical protein